VFKNFTISLIALVPVFTTVACTVDIAGNGQDAVVREERRLSLSGPARLSVQTFDGAIALRSWDRNEVLVEIERHGATTADAQAIEVKTSEDGGRVVVEALNERRRDVVHFGSWHSPQVNLRITAPRSLTLDVRTGDGPIAVQDLAGEIVLRTGDGSVRIERTEGRLRVTTGDGPVTMSGVQGGVELSTGDGSVDLSGRFDALRVRTGDGPIRIDALAGSAIQNEWSLESGDGSVNLRVPTGFNADIDAHTGDGTITAPGVARMTSEGERDHGVFRGRLGTGGPVLRLQTGDGPISITTR
jgi:hypothetical protein